MGLEKYTGAEQAAQDFAQAKQKVNTIKTSFASIFAGEQNKKNRERKIEDLELQRETTIKSNAIYNENELEHERISKEKALAMQKKNTKTETVYSNFVADEMNMLSTNIKNNEVLTSHIENKMKEWFDYSNSEEGINLSSEDRKLKKEEFFGSENEKDISLYNSMKKDKNLLEELNTFEQKYSERRDKDSYVEASRSIWDSKNMTYEQKLSLQNKLDQRAIKADGITESTIDTNRKYRSSINMKNFLSQELTPLRNSEEIINKINNYKALLSDEKVPLEQRQNFLSFFGYKIKDEKDAISTFDSIINDKDNDYSSNLEELNKRNKKVMENYGDHTLTKGVVATNSDISIYEEFGKSQYIGGTSLGYDLIETTADDERLDIIARDPNGNLYNILNTDQKTYLNSLSGTPEKIFNTTVSFLGDDFLSDNNKKTIYSRTSMEAGGYSFEMNEIHQMEGLKNAFAIAGDKDIKLFSSDNKMMKFLNKQISEEEKSKIYYYKKYLNETNQTYKVAEYNEAIAKYIIGTTYSMYNEKAPGKVLNRKKEFTSIGDLEPQDLGELFDSIGSPNEDVIKDGIALINNIFFDNDSIRMTEDNQGGYVPTFNGCKPLTSKKETNEFIDFAGNTMRIMVDGNIISSKMKNIRIHYSSDGRNAFLTKDGKKLYSEEGLLTIPTNRKDFEEGKYFEEIAERINLANKNNDSGYYHYKTAKSIEEELIGKNTPENIKKRRKKTLKEEKSTWKTKALEKQMMSFDGKKFEVPNGNWSFAKEGQLVFEDKPLFKINLKSIGESYLRLSNLSPLGLAKETVKGTKKTFDFFNDIGPQMVVDSMIKNKTPRLKEEKEKDELKILEKNIKLLEAETKKYEAKVIDEINNNGMKLTDAMEHVSNISSLLLLGKTDDEVFLEKKSKLSSLVNQIMNDKSVDEIKVDVETSKILKDPNANLLDKMKASFASEINSLKNTDYSKMVTGATSEEQIKTVSKITENEVTRKINGVEYTYPKLENVSNMIKTIEIISEKHNLDPELLKTISFIESNKTLNPFIHNPSTQWKISSASGMLQIINSSEVKYGTRNKDGSNSSTDPVVSLIGASKVISKDIKKIKREDFFLDNDFSFKEYYGYLTHQQGYNGLKSILKTSVNGNDFDSTILNNIRKNISKSKLKNFDNLIEKGDNKEAAKYFLDYWEKEYDSIKKQSSEFIEKSKNDKRKSNELFSDKEIIEVLPDVKKEFNKIYQNAVVTSISEFEKKIAKGETLNSRENKAYELAKNNFNVEISWDELDPEKQLFLAKYKKMGLLKKYPNLVQGIIEGDLLTVKSNYQIPDYYHNKEIYMDLIKDIKNMEDKKLLK